MSLENFSHAVLQLLDDLVLEKTGQNLDYLQKTIIEGTFDDKKYADIANEIHVSESHIRGKASELWKILGEILGENISKSNIRAILKRAKFHNNNIGRDFVSLNNVNICTNSSSSIEKSSKPISNSNKPLIDLGNAPDTYRFYGRLQELETLEIDIIQNKYRLITVLGLKGIGKTTLSIKLIENIKYNFEYIIYRDLSFCQNLDKILTDILNLTDTQVFVSQEIESKLNLLLAIIKKHKFLIILDDLQNIFSFNQLAGNYKSDHRDYQYFFKLMAEVNHQSCLILLSREKPIDSTFTEEKNKSIKTLFLPGLKEENIEIFEDYNLLDKQEWAKLINLYEGNPLWLKLTSSLIRELFLGKVNQFLQQENIVLGEALRQVLAEELQRLTLPEKIIMTELVKLNFPIYLKEVLRQSSLPISDSLNAIHSLVRRAMLTIKQDNEEITLHLNFVLKTYYVNYVAIE